MATSEQLRVIVFQDEGFYVAQCLEHDIVAQADDIESVIDRLELTIEAEMAMRETQSLESIPPAPPYYQDLWNKRSMRLERVTMPVDKCAPKFDVGLAQVA